MLEEQCLSQQHHGPLSYDKCLTYGPERVTGCWMLDFDDFAKKSFKNKFFMYTYKAYLYFENWFLMNNFHW